MDNKSGSFKATGMLIVISLMISAISFGMGYGAGRDDLEIAGKKKAVVRAALAKLNITPDQEAWKQWRETVIQRNEAIEKVNSIFSSGSASDVNTYDKVIDEFNKIKNILESSKGPPGAEWYREGAISEAKTIAEACTMIREGLKVNSARLIQDGVLLQEKADRDFADVTQRYEKWLKENGY